MSRATHKTASELLYLVVHELVKEIEARKLDVPLERAHIALEHADRVEALRSLAYPSAA